MTILVAGAAKGENNFRATATIGTASSGLGNIFYKSEDKILSHYP